MATPRFLVDEMLGRLARYLRFVGCDAEYVRGEPDAAIAARAAAEHRTLLTRDRALAAHAPGSIRIASPAIAEQWAELRRAVPTLPSEPRFDRCAVCNGRLGPYERGSAPDRETGLPIARAAAGLRIFSCGSCSRLYWDGSHTASVRARLARWSRDISP